MLRRKGGTEIKLNLKRIRSEREMAGLTAQEMADKLGVSKGHYYQVENGNRNFPMDLFIKYVNILGYNPAQTMIFFGD